MKKILAIILFSFVCLASSLFYWVSTGIDQFLLTKVNVPKGEFVVVPEGTHYHLFVRRLVAKGYIPYSTWARWAVKFDSNLSNIKAGTYQVQPNMSLKRLFVLIGSGREHQFSLTFIEGTRFSEWREQMREERYLKQTLDKMTDAQIASALAIKEKHLDGLFLPETYYYVSGETDISILERANAQLKSTLDTAWEARDLRIPIKSKYDLLILASIIEKETALAGERGKVASVFVNRLLKGMRLQTDPTVIYGMGDAYKGRIRKKDLRTMTPYNTYMIYGLPPSPIAMPSEASLFAAASPTKTPYYYFVANGLGGHQFSITLAEHNRAVRHYLTTLK